MNDTDVVNIARKMMRLSEEMYNCIAQIEEGDHPNAEAIVQVLKEECWFPAWPTHVIHYSLSEPDKWITNTRGDGDGILHRTAGKAALARKLNKINFNPA